MLSKCANPQCSTPLHYLREGRVYRVEVKENIPAEAPFSISSGVGRKSRMQHHWLCGECILRMTLHFDEQGGLSVIPKPAKIPAAQDFDLPTVSLAKPPMKKAVAS